MININIFTLGTCKHDALTIFLGIKTNETKRNETKRNETNNPDS